MQPMTFMTPPQALQVLMSILKARFWVCVKHHRCTASGWGQQSVVFTASNCIEA
jgi:hypothetical protein